MGDDVYQEEDADSQIDSSRLGVLNTLAKQASKQIGGSKGFGRLDLALASGAFNADAMDSNRLSGAEDEAEWPQHSAAEGNSDNDERTGFQNKQIEEILDSGNFYQTESEKCDS